MIPVPEGMTVEYWQRSDGNRVVAALCRSVTPSRLVEDSTEETPK